ncbi:P-loop NTPase family protein [Ferrimonas sediminicola]|uniref:AAA family ATPase n=1 Tax=Ferrimonas sediminicola TaxID=2569538 RepID=UPI00197ACC1A|nr:AAA family ATPase [Ferrimonas sediminicola]
MSSSGALKDAIEQCRGYASRRGVQTAIISNGYQWIAFLASRTDGKDIFDGDAIVFLSLESILSNFNFAWDMLSKSGVDEGRIFRQLTDGTISLPNKLSTFLRNHPKIRYATDTQASLRQLSELFLQDAMESEELEKQFYKECYCDSGALNKYAMLSKNILNARYSSMLSKSEQHPTVLPVNTKKGTNFTPEIMSEAMARRPIVLVGDVGVGKTSFVKNLTYNSAFAEFRDSIFVYINLGAKAILNQALRNVVLNEIETQLYDKYDVDINELPFVKGVYHKKFSRGIYGSYKESDPQKYQDELVSMLASLLSNKSEHVRRSVEHMSKARKKQVIISVDNADQREFDIQQEAFLISQELAKEWSATVFLSVRPQTLYKSKRSGALTAYPHKIFTISPPRVDEVVKKRLIFAAKMARGEHKLEMASVKSENLAVFLDALVKSLHNNRELNEFLTNMTGGNIRATFEFVTSFIGSPNVEAEKIIEIMEREGEYRVPLHEFTKQALLGGYSHYSAETSLSMNILDLRSPDKCEHFLVPVIISYLDLTGSHLDKDGFCDTSVLMEECQRLGFTIEQVEFALRRATNKKLIETSLRVTFEEDEDSKLIGDMPDSFRVTTSGVYHVKKWLGEFTYLDAMLFDTPIMDRAIREQILSNLESFNIEHRLERATLFKSYLESCWSEFKSSPSYFNFEDSLKIGDGGFERVATVVRKNQGKPKRAKSFKTPLVTD